VASSGKDPTEKDNAEAQSAPRLAEKRGKGSDSAERPRQVRGKRNAPRQREGESDPGVLMKASRSEMGRIPLHPGIFRKSGKQRT
jgi:hypothetical protein